MSPVTSVRPVASLQKVRIPWQSSCNIQKDWGGCETACALEYRQAIKLAKKFHEHQNGKVQRPMDSSGFSFAPKSDQNSRSLCPSPIGIPHPPEAKAAWTVPATEFASSTTAVHGFLEPSRAGTQSGEAALFAPDSRAKFLEMLGRLCPLRWTDDKAKWKCRVCSIASGTGSPEGGTALNAASGGRDRDLRERTLPKERGRQGGPPFYRRTRPCDRPMTTQSGKMRANAPGRRGSFHGSMMVNDAFIRLTVSSPDLFWFSPGAGSLSRIESESRWASC
jgi:hypothetical protein